MFHVETKFLIFLRLQGIINNLDVGPKYKPAKKIIDDDAIDNAPQNDDNITDIEIDRTAQQNVN